MSQYTIPTVVNTETNAAPKSSASIARSFRLRENFFARRSLTTVGSGATPTPGATITPAPTPACAYPPNVIGQAPAAADANLGAAGFNNVDIFGDLTTGQKNKIQAQNPDHTQCVALNDLFTLHYRPN